MKDVQCYELFGGIALKNHAFSFFYIFHLAINIIINIKLKCVYIFEYVYACYMHYVDKNKVGIICQFI